MKIVVPLPRQHLGILFNAGKIRVTLRIKLVPTPTPQCNQTKRAQE